MVDGMNAFDRSMGSRRSELVRPARFRPHCLLGAFAHSAAIVWMDALPDHFVTRYRLLLIKAPDSEGFPQSGREQLLQVNR